VIGFDRIRIDDPVGALSVHLANGIFGTLAVGLFAEGRFTPNTTGDGLFFGGGTGLLFHQLIGIGAVGAFTFLVALGVWYLLKLTLGIRVSPEEELEGLDVGEHGMSAYPDFAAATEHFGDMGGKSGPRKAGLSVASDSPVVAER
jgi:Amt family ammonium transporter